MEIYEDELNRMDIAIWDAIKGLSDVKECIEDKRSNTRDDLKRLQNQLMEASEWLNKYTIE